MDQLSHQVHPDSPASALPNQPPQQVVLGLALGYLASRSLHVAAGLGVADLLAQGSMSVDELARATHTHRPSLFRLLRMLAGHGVFSEAQPGTFELTPAAALLRTDVPATLRDAVLMIGDLTGERSWWDAVGQLRHSVATGEPAFEHVTGTGFFDYLEHHPAAGRWFDKGLANFTTTENVAIARACDFSRYRSVVDVGGGGGGFLAEILKAHPEVTGVLFDLPHVVRSAGVSNDAALAARARIVAGDFFESVPAGHCAYTLKRVLHDWSDARCVQILRRCCEAIGHARGRVLVIDAVVPPGNQFHPSKDMDILMMLLAGGRERTADEFRELLRDAGLLLTRILPTPSVLSVIEAEPIREAA